jgi:hypothetical protein
VTTPPQVTVAPGLRAAPIGRAIGRWLPEGRPWGGDRLDLIARRLRDHPEIADVAVVAVPATDGEATPVFHVTPQPRRDVSAALSTDAPGALLGLGAEVHAVWRGLGGHLASLRSDTTAVWRLFDGPPGALVRQAQTGPYLREQLTLTAALAPLARLDLRVAAAGELVTQRGYMYGAGRAELGLALRPSPHVTLWAGMRGGYVQYFPGIQQKDPFDEAFSGDALARAHDLFAVVLAADVDTVPGEALPTHGFRLHLEASPWGSAAGTPFSRVEGRLEGYATPIDPLTLVVRAGAGLHQHDDATGALLANRFFLGGITDVRGFGYRRLGAPGSRGGLEDVYTGGDAMLWASLEAQLRLHPDVLAAAFTDVGRVWDTPSASGALSGERPVSMLDLVPTSGLGLLVRTPIGGVGGWLGARWFQDIDMIDAPPRFGFHFRTITQF